MNCITQHPVKQQARQTFTPPGQQPLRILVADDEPDILDAYRMVLGAIGTSPNPGIAALRSKLFGGAGTRHSPSPGGEFDIVYTGGAEAAVAAVRESRALDRRFAVVFLDMRMPPGPDGAWAAAKIRALDPKIDIVISTAYADIDPDELSQNVPPAAKIFYVQKPFHPHEIRQLAVALGQKWQAENKILRLAYYDHLTGLPNRAFFMTRLEQAIDTAREEARSLAVLFLDLDNFKPLNDAHGHDAGDLLLVEVAHRLQACIREMDTVARIGGDEFVVMINELNTDPCVSRAEAQLIAEKIRASLAQPYLLRVEGDGAPSKRATVVQHQCTVSIGVVLFSDHAVSQDIILKWADSAMYAAKGSGRNAIHFHNAKS